MTGEIRTLILTVDLDCHCCSKKIKKAICKLQERECIQKIEYDEKKNTVTISGPFDPVKLKNKLCCKACEVIKNIIIIELKPPKTPPPPTPTPTPTPTPEPPKKHEPVYLPCWPVGLTIPAPVCRCRPCYVGCKDICRCCTCGCGGQGPHSLPVVGKCTCGCGGQGPYSLPVVGKCTCGCGGQGPHSLSVVGKPITHQFSCDYEEAPPACNVM